MAVGCDGAPEVARVGAGSTDRLGSWIVETGALISAGGDPPGLRDAELAAWPHVAYQPEDGYAAIEADLPERERRPALAEALTTTRAFNEQWSLAVDEGGAPLC
jgi:hypothetical protein